MVNLFGVAKYVQDASMFTREDVTKSKTAVADRVSAETVLVSAL